MAGVALCVWGVAPIHAQRQMPVKFDSFVLERSPCYGTCPAYRLELDHDGRVVFESLNAEDAGRTEEARIDSMSVRRLWLFAQQIRFDELPDNIEHSFFCGMGFDAGYAKVTLVTNLSTKWVRDNLACPWAPAALRHLETALDSVANSKRWIRPTAGVFGKRRPPG